MVAVTSLNRLSDVFGVVFFNFVLAFIILDKSIVVLCCFGGRDKFSRFGGIGKPDSFLLVWILDWCFVSGGGGGTSGGRGGGGNKGGGGGGGGIDGGDTDGAGIVGGGNGDNNGVSDSSATSFRDDFLLLWTFPSEFLLAAVTFCLLTSASDTNLNDTFEPGKTTRGPPGRKGTVVIRFRVLLIGRA